MTELEAGETRPGVVVTGVSGRMGRTLAALVLDSPDMRLVGGLERPGGAAVGEDIGRLLGRDPVGVIVEDDPLPAFARAQAVIDFTSPAATVEFAALAAQARAVHVIGTTGLEAGDLARIAAAARHATIIRAGNMSLGVNLLLGLTRKVAQALGPEFDIEIVEMHHRHKVDAPSGTALLLGRAAAEAESEALGRRQRALRLAFRAFDEAALEVLAADLAATVETLCEGVLGEAARDHADVVIVTDDNPRTEDPALIRAAVMASAGPDATEIADRAEAILRAVDGLEPGDAALICGKGHETGQIVGSDVFPFDDAEQASVAVAALDGRI